MTRVWVITWSPKGFTLAPAAPASTIKELSER
jgi:hypothetical protein